MRDETPLKLQRGDERLMLTCMVVERLCVDRVPASVRLEAAIGTLDVPNLVVSVARRLITRTGLDLSGRDARRTVAAA
jgi:hypothetical protein